MIVFAVCNHKGGTGKTTTVLHLAAALGLSSRRTLAIDVDPQGFLTRAMGVPEPDRANSALALFDHEADLSALTPRPMEGFDLLPSSSALTKHMRSLNKPTDVLWAKEALEADWTDAYDVIIFDTAAAVTVYSLNALVASRHVVIPVLPEYQSVVGAEQTFQTADVVRSRLNPRLGPSNFLLTQVDARKSIHHTYRRYMREKYGERVLEQLIRTSTALAEAREDGTTLFDHNPQARGARDYANAADELLRRMRDQQAADDAPAAAPKPVDLDPPTPRAVNS